MDLDFHQNTDNCADWLRHSCFMEDNRAVTIQKVNFEQI